MAGLVVDSLRVFLVQGKIISARRVLKQVYCLRIEKVLFSFPLPLVNASLLQPVGPLPKCETVAHEHFFSEVVERQPINPADRAAEAAVDYLCSEAERFKNLRRLIRLKGTDAHLRHHFQQPVSYGLLIVREGSLISHPFAELSGFDQGVNCFQCKVRVHRTCTVTDDGGKWFTSQPSPASTTRPTLFRIRFSPR